MAMQTLLGRLARYAVAALLVASAPVAAEAQVGIASNMTQIALVARVSPRGSISAVGAQRETARMGTVREATVSVGVSANTGYQLIVRAVAATSSRIWVRAVNGEFQELKAGSAVTVAKDSHCAGQWERSVQFRIEMAEGADQMQPLPVRYEIAISPTI
ncbi:MAG: hypothetical protein ACJ8BF_14255 [Gemmatimonadales bacterium]